MNRKARRAAGDTGPRDHTNVPLMVAFIKREVKKFKDGSEVAVSYFAPVTADGLPLLEDEGPNAPEMVLFATVPVVVKAPSAILTGPALVRA